MRDAKKNGNVVESISKHEEDEFSSVRFRVRYIGAARNAWIDEDELQATAPHILARYWMKQE